MGRKGTARVKASKSIWLSEPEDNDDGLEEPAAAVETRRRAARNEITQNSPNPKQKNNPRAVIDLENVDPTFDDELGLPAGRPASGTPRPSLRQASLTVESEKANHWESSNDLALSLFPSAIEDNPIPSIEEPPDPSIDPFDKSPEAQSCSRAFEQVDPRPRISQKSSRDEHQPQQSAQPELRLDSPSKTQTEDMSGGAYIPPAQQRNMRACMVCSVVRTQQQFMTSGCPNCEDFLELAGNADMIADCTSQVFEGLISVANTTKSWVARYQRLEGYKPGVYATQVEGVLPDDILAAVENAGVNYVPRDGSEQDMLPKE